MNPEPSSTKNTTRRKWIFLALLPVCLLILILLTFLLLPSLLEHATNRMVKHLRKEAALEFRVRNIGFGQSHLSVGAWVPGKKQGERLRMALGDIMVQYSPSGLAGGDVDSIQISNIGIPVSWKDGTADIPLLALFASAGQTSRSSTPQSPDAPFFSMPVNLRHAALSGNLLLSVQEEFMILPFSAELNFHPRKDGVSVQYTFQLMIPGGNFLSARGTADLQTGRLSLNAVSAIRLETLPYSIRMLISRDPKLKGELFLETSLLADLKKKTVRTLSSKLKMKEVHWPPVQGSGEWDVKLADGNTLTVQYDGDFGCAPGGLPVSLRQMRFRHESGTGTLTGDAVLRAGHSADGDFPAKFTLARTKEGVPELHLTPCGRHKTPRNFTLAGWNVSFPAWEEKTGEIRLTFGKEITLRGECSVPQIRVHRQTLAAELENIRIALNGPIRDLHLNASVSALRLNTETRALLSLKNFSLNTGLNGKRQGTFEIPEVTVLQAPPGKIAGTLELEPEKSAFRLRAGTDLLGFHSDFSASFQGAGPSLELMWNLPEQSLPKPVALSAFAPELDFTVRSMKLSASAAFHWTPQNQSGSAKIKMDGFTLDSEQYKIKLADASLRFSLPNLPDLKSAPGASFHFQALEYDKIRMDTGRIAFRMDSPDVWQLESALFHWCGGKIRLGAVRIAPKTERFSATLSCDRVKLGKLLSQFGVGTDAGDSAELNGTIPVSIRNGAIRFRNGFLYSTPGETGILRLIPNATVSAMGASSVEMSFALDAMKDFQYQWVKITLNSEQEEMLLKFQLDGKPSNPLHYAIDKDSGRPVRSEGTNRFQGIPLSINLKLPLQKSLELYQTFHKLWSKQ